MKKNFLVLFASAFLFSGCDVNQSLTQSHNDVEKAVNLNESKGCEGNKGDEQIDEVSFAQSSKLDSSDNESGKLEFDEQSEDSGCTL